MKYLLLSHFRDLRRRWLSTLSVTVGLGLAVMGVIVVHVLGDQAVREIGTVGIQSNYQYVVPIYNYDEGKYFRLRQAWRSGEIPRIKGMVPVIQGTVASKGALVPILGIDPLADPQAISGSGLVTGAPEIELLTQDSLIAIGNNWEVGVEVKGARIIAHLPSQSELLIADIATVQRILNRPGEIDAIWMRRAPIAHSSLIDRIWPGLLTGWSYRSPRLKLDGFDIQDMTYWNPTHSFAGSIAFNLSLLGLLAVLVSALISYESCASNVVRRSKERERLEAFGVTPSEIRIVYVAEALLLSIAGSLIGVLASVVLLGQLDLLDENVNSGAFAFGTGKAAVIGAISFLAAASLATLQKRPRRPTMALIVFALAASSLLLSGSNSRTGVAGAFIVILALCILHVLLVIFTLSTWIRRVSPHIKPRRLQLRMVWRQVAQQLDSYRLPISTYSIAIAAAVGIGIMVSAFRINFEDLLDQRLRPGLYLSNAAEIDVAQVSAWDEVSEIREYYRSTARRSTGPINVTAATLDEWETSRYGYDEEVLEGALINQQLAIRHRVSVGSNLLLSFDRGQHILVPVVHIFNSYGSSQSQAIIPIYSIDTNKWIRDRLTLTVPQQHMADVSERLLRTSPSVSIQDATEIRTAALRVFDQTFVLTSSISFVAVLVAVVGVFTAALATQGDRTREYRLLRTVGIPEKSIALSALLQSGALGGLASLAAAPLGIGIAWCLCSLVNPRAFNWTIDFHIVPVALLLPLCLGACAATLASLAPFFMRRKLE